MANHDISYEYDAAGNRTRMIDNLTGEVTTYTYDKRHQLLNMADSNGTTTFTYDADGNRTRKETPSELTEYSWDAEDHLTDVQTVNDEIHFTYNPDGQRTKKESNAGTVSYLYDFNHLLQEMDGDDQTEKLYTFTDDQWGDLISEYGEEDGSLYHQYDAQWSTQALLDEDQSVTDRYKYRAFGLQDHAVGSSKAPHTFVGKQGYYRDSELDLYMLGMGNGDGLGGRFYDPELGRFISEDPLRYDAGDQNLYRYVRNNPINVIDPSGQRKKPWLEWEILGGFGRRRVGFNVYQESPRGWGAIRGKLNDAETSTYWTTYYGKDCNNRDFEVGLGTVHWFKGDIKNLGENMVLRHVQVSGAAKVFARIAEFQKATFEMPRKKGPLSPNNKSKNDLIHDIDQWFASENSISPDKVEDIRSDVTVLDVFFKSAGALLTKTLGIACDTMERFSGVNVCEMLKELGDVVSSVFSEPQQFLGTLSKGVSEGVKSFIRNLPDTLGDAFRSIFGIPERIGNLVLNFAGADFDPKNLLPFAAKVVGATWENVEAALKSRIPGGYGEVIGMFKLDKCHSQSKEKAADFAALLRCALDNFVESVQEKIDSLEDKVKQTINIPADGNLADLFEQNIGEIAKGIKEQLLGQLVEIVVKNILPVLVPAGAVLVKIYNLIKTINDKKEQFQEAVLGIFGGIQGILQQLKAGDAPAVTTKVKEVLDGLVKPGLLLAASLITGAMKFIDTVKDAITKILNAIPALIRKVVDYIATLLCKVPGLNKLLKCPNKKKNDPCDDDKKKKAACFVSGTLLHDAHGLNAAVSDVHSGRRFIPLMDAERDELNWPEPPPLDTTGLQRFDMVMQKPDGGRVDIEMLRRPDELLDDGVQIGSRVLLNMPEMGAEGQAEVLAIDADPAIEKGPGRLITSVFRHTAREVYDLKLESESKPIGVTATHPFWSVDREAWVSAIDLEMGETLKTLAGTTVVESRSKREEPETVYNIEVEGDHVYRVGESGVLVHNASAPKRITSSSDWFAKQMRKWRCSQKGNLLAPKASKTRAILLFTIDGKSDREDETSAGPSSKDHAEALILTKIENRKKSGECIDNESLYVERKPCQPCETAIDKLIEIGGKVTVYYIGEVGGGPANHDGKFYNFLSNLAVAYQELGLSIWPNDCKNATSDDS